jgi:predicted nucleic acid-binding Zn ribbon protein
LNLEGALVHESSFPDNYDDLSEVHCLCGKKMTIGELECFSMCFECLEKELERAREERRKSAIEWVQHHKKEHPDGSWEIVGEIPGKGRRYKNELDADNFLWNQIILAADDVD